MKTRLEVSMQTRKPLGRKGGKYRCFIARLQGKGIVVVSLQGVHEELY